MLRRYNSKNLDTILLKNRRTTIGSADTCDVVVKGKGIATVHASIESNSSGFWLREHSLSGITRVNDRPVFGQVAIQSGDLIQVGGAPPFVFDSEWMFGTRPSSAKPTSEKLRSVANSPAPELSILPVIGKKVIHATSGARPKRSASQDQSQRSSASSTETTRYYNNVRSVGNNLLQRVVKLQAEVIEKDEKIRQLTSQPVSHMFYQPSLPPPLPPPPSQFVYRKSHAADQKSFELFAYRAFIGAIASQLRQFNDRVLRTPQRDSAELFSAMCRAVDIPMTTRIVEVEKYCEAVLIDNDFEEGDELIQRLNTFIRESRREKIVELTNELEVLMPLIRDVAYNARENIKVCNAFTQWSRQFGDLLRKSSFSSTVLFQAIDDLKTQFSEAHMSRHWLPPSITPILRLAALELEKRDGEVTPATVSPRVQMDRKKSIDMTVDNCISQVETITHEMDYHIVRLFNKAKDYSTFQSLDLDSVTRITKIVESLKSSIEMLAEHSFKEDPPRPNSVLFFEITNDDITSSRKKSDEEGSTGSLRSVGSNGSAKKVSIAPKIPDPLSEDEEILEERKEVEEQILGVVKEIQNTLRINDLEHTEPTRREGMVTIDASVLKMLIQQSRGLLAYCNTHQNHKEEKMCAKPPQIVVEDSLEKEKSSDGHNEDNREEHLIEEPDSIILPVQPVPAEPVELSDPEDNLEYDSEDRSIETPDSEKMLVRQKSSVVVMNVPNELRMLRKSYSEDTQTDRKISTRSATVESHEHDPISPPPSPEENEEESEHDDEPDQQNEHEEHHDEDGSDHSEDREHGIENDKDSDHSSEHEGDEEHPESLGKKDITKDEQSDDHPVQSEDHHSDPEDPQAHPDTIDDESEEEREEPIPFADEDKSTVRYVPNNTSQELSEPEALPPVKANGDIRRRDSERISSHLRSHINTANGKPHITYQYPIKYYSPPMKRRSKSEDQKIRETLASRPPFVLY